MYRTPVVLNCSLRLRRLDIVKRVRRKLSLVSGVALRRERLALPINDLARAIHNARSSAK